MGVVMGAESLQFKTCPSVPTEPIGDRVQYTLCYIGDDCKAYVAQTFLIFQMKSDTYFCAFVFLIFFLVETTTLNQQISQN